MELPDHEAEERLTQWYIQYHAWLCDEITYRDRTYPRRLSMEEVSDIALETLNILNRETHLGNFVYRSDRELKAWLKKTARFTYLNYRKKADGTIYDYAAYEKYLETATDGMIDRLESEEEELFKSELTQTLNACVHELSPEDQTVINLYYYGAEKEKIKTIAKIMGKTETATKGRLFQARQRLKQKLAEKGFDDEEEILNSL